MILKVIVRFLRTIVMLKHFLFLYKLPAALALRGHICQFVRIRDVPNLGDKQQHEVCTKLGDKDLKLFQNFKYWVYPGLEIV